MLRPRSAAGLLAALLACLAASPAAAVTAAPAPAASISPATNVSPAAYAESRRWTVRTIRIEGAERSRRSAILSAIRVAEGQVFERVSLAALEAEIVRNLNNLKFFFKVDVRFVSADEHLDIVLVLHDKWTLFPIPMIQYFEDRWAFGMLVVEGNFLGTMNQLGGGVFVAGGRPTFAGVLMLRDFPAERLVFNATGLFGHQRVYEYDGKTQLRHYIQQADGLILNLIYPLHANLLVGTLRCNMFRYSYESDGFAGPPLPRTGWETFLDASLIWEGLSFVEDYAEGARLRLSLGADAPFLGSDFRRAILSWKANIAVNPVARHNLVLMSMGAFGRRLEYGYRFEVGGTANQFVQGVRGYHDGQFKGDAFVNNQLEYRIPFWTLPHFIFSFVPFLDHAATAEPGKAAWTQSLGYGLSVRTYLRRVLLPALIVYGAFAEGNGEWRFGFNLGAQL